MPIYFIIYSSHAVGQFYIKRIHLAIPTTLEEAERVYRQYSNMLYNSGIYPHLQTEYVARDVAFIPDGMIASPIPDANATSFVPPIRTANRIDVKPVQNDSIETKKEEVTSDSYDNWADWE